MIPDSVLSSIETPCLVIDVKRAEKNILSMQERISAAGCSLRPHIKTHKMPFFAKLQLAAGACGITCAKVSEAEVMADNGIDDIFIAYPVIGKYKILRAIALSQKIKRLILSVDSYDGAVQLAQIAEESGACIEVRIELDTGYGRTGIPLEQALEFAVFINSLHGIKLTGIYTFKSLTFQGQPTQNPELAACEEASILSDLASRLGENGIEIRDISGGSSPTAVEVARTGKVNEVRPGTYIFNDYMQFLENACSMEEIAVRQYVTVISSNKKEYAVVDGGCKFFPADTPPGSGGLPFNGYSFIESNPDLELKRMNEEHGMIYSKSGNTNLRTGQVISLIPNHVCTAINMVNWVYLYEDGCLKKEPVAARGMFI